MLTPLTARLETQQARCFLRKAFFLGQAAGTPPDHDERPREVEWPDTQLPRET